MKAPRIFRGHHLLTPREKELVELWCSGKTKSEVAEELGISYNTMKNHSHNIYTKLGVRNIYQLFALILEEERQWSDRV